MAVFNPSPNPTNDPNWLGLSKPIGDVPANKTAGMALSLVGNAAELGVGIADEVIKDSNKKEAYKDADISREALQSSLTDNINNLKNGVAASPEGTTMSLLPPGSSKNPAEIPQGVQNGLNTANRIGNAMMNNAGKVNDTLYTAQAEATAKRLRAQWPGYREYIDDIVSKAYGVPVANAHFKNLLADYNTLYTQLNSQNTKIEERFSKNQDIPFNNQWRSDVITGKKTFDQYLEYENGFRSDQQATRDAAAALDLKSKRGEDDSREKEGMLDTKFKEISSNNINAVFNTEGPIKTLLEKAKTNSLTPQEALDFSTSLNTLKARNAQQMQEWLETQTWSKALKRDAIESRVKLYNTRLDNIIQLVQGENKYGGLIGYQEKSLALQKDAALIQLYNHPKIGGQTQMLGALQTSIGPQAAGIVVDQALKTDFKSNMSEAFKNWAVDRASVSAMPSNILVPKGINKTLPKDEIQAAKDAKISPDSGVYDATFNTRLKILLSKDVPIENKKELVSNIFDPKNDGVLKEFKPDEVQVDSSTGKSILVPGRQGLFSYLTSPAVSTEIEKVTSGDPKLREMYLSWVKRNWETDLVTQDVAQLNGIDQKRFYYQFNDGTKEGPVGFSLIDKSTNLPVRSRYSGALDGNPNEAYTFGQGRPRVYASSSEGVSAATSLERLNRTLPNMMNVLKTFGDSRSTADIMKTVLGTIGFNPNDPVLEAKEGLNEALDASKLTPMDRINQGVNVEKPIERLEKSLKDYLNTNGPYAPDPVAKYITQYVPFDALDKIVKDLTSSKSKTKGNVREGSLIDQLIEKVSPYLPNGEFPDIKRGPGRQGGNQPGTQPTLNYTSEPRPMSLGQWLVNPANLTPVNDLNRPGPIIAPAQQAPQPTPQDISEDLVNNPTFDRYDPQTGRTYMKNGLTQDQINKMKDAENRAKRNK